MRNSCGAIFYTYNPDGVLGIILGEEGNKWFPFKGCVKKGETFEETAKREIKEETCGLVCVDNIKLEHRFSSKRKNYYIGLCYVPYSIIKEFENIIQLETRIEYKEKKRLKFFPVDVFILYNNDIHSITKSSIEFYWDKLMQLNNKNIYYEMTRYHGVSFNYKQNKKTINSCKPLHNISACESWRSSIL
jgi:ADP-ribose pyrophosphatase YjhB (NUDIX family)